jgi:hypothetical protein
MAQTNDASPMAQSTAAAAEADLHLARLHKMSTTAGVTNTDYVAVNQTAVVALVLGVLSSIALLGSLLLVVPVVGVVFAIVAIRQINDSSGTQTGKAMAWAGLALCVVFAGAKVTWDVMAGMSVRQDEERIAATIAELGKDVREGDYASAYKLFDDPFQNRVKIESFKKTWEAVQAPKPLGRVKVLEWNQVTPVFESAAGGRSAIAQARMSFTNTAGQREERVDLVLRQVGSKWLIMRFETFFPEPRRPRQPQQEDVFDDERLQKPRK